jgi:hypothetical protein
VEYDEDQVVFSNERISETPLVSRTQPLNDSIYQKRQNEYNSAGTSLKEKNKVKRKEYESGLIGKFLINKVVWVCEGIGHKFNVFHGM